MARSALERARAFQNTTIEPNGILSSESSSSDSPPLSDVKFMRDYLQRAGKGWRIACAAAITAAALAFVAIFGLLCVMAYKEDGFRRNNTGLITALALMALFAFCSFHLAWRLWRGSVSRNGVTSMPTWFIQLFGVCFLAGAIVVALSGGNKVSLIENTSIGLTMIFVGRNIARRKQMRRRNNTTRTLRS